MPNVAAIIVAAGSGSRFGKEKQIELLDGIPLYERVLNAFAQVPQITQVILVGSEELLREVHASEHLHVIPGGDSRQASVGNGLLKAEALGAEYVVVHDAARALVTPQIIHDVLTAAIRFDAAIAACPVVDTLKRATDLAITATIPRTDLWRAQTPQAVRTSDLRQAFNLSLGTDKSFTDESEMLEAMGIKVHIVPSPESNFKITYPEDLELARKLLGVSTEY